MSLSVRIAEITEGWTSPLDFQLQLNGAVFDATGMTVQAVIADKDRAPVTIATAWQAITTSVVRLSPGATDFKAANAPYSVHFKVTDGAGKVAFFPQGIAAHIAVYQP